jgi:class I fructose-bisphosphate aldolase
MPLVDPDERMLVIAMDHARALGAVRGLEAPGTLIDTMIEAGADAVMTSFGTVKAYRERLVGRVPVYLRLDGGPSIVKE